MSRLPNMPPLGAGEKDPARAKSGPSGTRTLKDGPNPAGPGPASQEPPQMPFLHSQGDSQGTFISDDQFMHDFLKESHTVPQAVLMVGALLTFLIYGYQGFVASDPGMGLAGAFGSCIFVSILMAVSCLTSTAAGWVICKVFGEDYGSPGALFLRFSAVAVAQFPVFAAINAAVGGLLSLFFFMPVMLLLAIFVAGLDVIRAFLFCALLCLVNWILIAFVLVSFATAFMA